MSKGKLIVIEGVFDCVKKSTQYRLLIDRLQNDKNNVIVTHHFPSYGTYQGRPVSEYLKGNYGKIAELSPYFVNSLYAQDRAITWFTGLKEEYEKGSIIVLDRYTTSSLIYQSASIENKEEKDKFINFVFDYEYCKMGLPEPDIVVFLYAPIEVAMGTKKNESDRLYMKNISDTAVSLAKKFNWNFIECNDGDKMRSPEDIHEEIYNLVKNKL